MKQSKTIKLFQPITCPHCRKEFYIGIQSAVSEIVSTSTINDIEMAKEKIRERLNEIDFYSEEDKQEVLNYLNHEETIVDMSDVKIMIKQIQQEEIIKKQQK